MRARGVARVGRSAIVVSLLLVAAACGASRQSGPLPPRQASATVRLDNRSPAQVTVYALRGGMRVRLGEASGSMVTILRIPENVLQGATSLRFQIDPLGGTSRTSSYEIMVSPGDQVMVVYP